MANYNNPQPMQWNPYPANPMVPPMGMMHPSAVSPFFSYPYMSPCYPISPAYAEKGYLHGMQAPDLPWSNPIDNTPPAASLVESMYNQSPNEPPQRAFTESAPEGPAKKTMKIPRKSSKQPLQKLDDRTMLHNFIQQKSHRAESQRISNSKSNEPWVNR
jgi:hypothetical protein